MRCIVYRMYCILGVCIVLYRYYGMSHLPDILQALQKSQVVGPGALWAQVADALPAGLPLNQAEAGQSAGWRCVGSRGGIMGVPRLGPPRTAVRPASRQHRSRTCPLAAILERSSHGGPGENWSVRITTPTRLNHHSCRPLPSSTITVCLGSPQRDAIQYHRRNVFVKNKV